MTVIFNNSHHKRADTISFDAFLHSKPEGGPQPITTER